MDLSQKGEKTGLKVKSQCQQSTALWVVLILAFVLSTCALALSVYTSVAKTKQDKKLEETDIQLDRITATIDNMNQRTNVSLDLDAYNTSIYLALNSLQTLFQELNDTVELSIYLSEQRLTTNMVRNELNLTAGCSSDTISTCGINHNNDGTPPASLTCETPEHPIEVAGMRNVNIFCSIDNSAGEVNPIFSILNIFNEEVSCLCGLVVLTVPTASSWCRLTIQRCPEKIRVNTTQLA